MVAKQTSSQYHMHCVLSPPLARWRSVSNRAVKIPRTAQQLLKTAFQMNSSLKICNFKRCECRPGGNAGGTLSCRCDTKNALIVAHGLPLVTGTNCRRGCLCIVGGCRLGLNGRNQRWWIVGLIVTGFKLRKKVLFVPSEGKSTAL